MFYLTRLCVFTCCLHGFSLMGWLRGEVDGNCCYFALVSLKTRMILGMGQFITRPKFSGVLVSYLLICECESDGSVYFF